DSGSDKLVLMPGGTVGIGTTTIMSANGSTGVLTLGGTGGTYNENLVFDFESEASVVNIVTSGSRFDIADNMRINNDRTLDLGTNGYYRMGWETTGNNNAQIGLYVGNSSYSGYVSIMEKDDMGNANRSPSGTSADPVFRVYSSDEAQASDYIEMYHDQTDAYINAGVGSLTLQSPSTFNIDATGGNNTALVFREDNDLIQFALAGRGDENQTNFGVDDDGGNQLNLTNYLNITADHDHAPQTNPTLYVHSDTNPDTDNTQWLSFSHDQTDAVIDWGKGNLSLASSTATTTIAGGFDVASGGLVYDRSTGNVGVGTAVPTHTLHISSASTEPFYVDSGGYNQNTKFYSSDDITAISIEDDDTVISLGVSGTLFAIAMNTASLTTPEFVINTSGNVGIGTTSPWANLSVNQDAGEVGFAIGSSTATSFVVDASGRVGIGTVAPATTLDVNGTSIFRSTMYLASNNRLYLDGGEDTYVYNPSDDEIRFVTGDGTPLMIDNGGNVGIGTTSPYAKLSVVGEAVAEYFTATSTTATSTFYGNVYVVGNLEVDGATFDYVFDSQTDIKAIKAFVEEHGHLPFIDAYIEPIASINIGTMIGQIWESVERAWMAIFEHEDRLDVLEKRIDDLERENEVLRDYQPDGEAAAEGGGESGGDENGDTGETETETDTTPPTITIQGNNPATIEIGTTYVDLGALITDDQDENPTTYTYLNGATTTNVSIDTSEAGTHTVTYTATDDAGNTASADRTVIVGNEDEPDPEPEEPEPEPDPEDTTPPTITLIGEAQVTITEGETYVDLGATATDPVTTDGSEEPTSNGAGDTGEDITASIITNSTVDTTTPGTYQVTYNVSDAAGNNATEVVRNVTIEATPVTDPEEPPAEEDDNEESEPDPEPDPDPEPEV
ncbi:MAG: DUF5011 domain-containing protein, partial [Candidatus Pacebacteria bacterium]|nr:DUF5011 domain-containing protein [Candidatus Paceibacterota bacterium]